MKDLLEKISNAFLEMEKTKLWMEERGQRLDPRIEADRYRELAQKVHIRLATEEVGLKD